jgi:hypothetical protein
MKKSVCVVCKNEKKGTPVEDDLYLDTIRNIKTKLNVAKNNKLVVCKDCLPQARDKRRRFERTFMMWAVLATVFFVMLVVMYPSLQSIFYGLVFVVIFILLSLLLYFPRVEEYGGKK